MTGVFTKRREAQRRLSCAETETQRRRWPHEDGGGDRSDASTSQGTKDYLQTPAARRGKTGFSPIAFRGSMVLPTPWFQTSSLQNSKTVNFYYFKPPSLWYFVTTALGNYYTRLHLPSIFTASVRWSRHVLEQDPMCCLMSVFSYWAISRSGGVYSSIAQHIIVAR